MTFANVSVSDYQNSVSEIDKCTAHTQGKIMLSLGVSQPNLYMRHGLRSNLKDCTDDGSLGF